MEYEKIEAISYENDYEYSCFMNIVSRDHDESSRLCKTVSNMKNLRLLIVSLHNGNGENVEGVKFLSNELRYMKWSNYPPSPFPDSFQPVNLVVLKLCLSMQKELWKGYKHLLHLKVLQLKEMIKLHSTPDFNGLPRLQQLTLHDCMELEEIHPSLGNHTSLEYLQVPCCYKLKRIPTISQMKNIKSLLIMWCHVKDGDIPYGIGELSNLQELDLSGNRFSRLDFSLSQLTRLKSLNLSFCDELLELPELPSSLAILAAHQCKSLTVVGDLNKCKELCQVSLKDGWSDKLLQSILEGKAIENGSMHLHLKGLEIPKVFTPPLLGGSNCRLKLPENWCNDFSGFLMCFVTSSDFYETPNIIWISMKHMSGMYYEDDVVWEESDGDGGGDKHTLVWYVSFVSLRHTAWWDQTYNAVSFNIENPLKIRDDEFDSGFGVRLVDKKSSSLIETSTYSSSHYTP